MADGFKFASQRRPNKESNYILPNDMREASRQDIQHIVYRKLMHGNYNAPVEDALQRGIKVIDVGCGSGHWVLDMALDYPNSSFTGIDAEDVFPTSSDLPANVRFLKANTVKGLPFADGTFDYVFQRFMNLSFTPNDWRIAVQELARVAKPGGWVEVFDRSFKLERAPSNTTVHDALIALSKPSGINTDYIWKIGTLLSASNIVDIEKDSTGCPMNWGGRLGELHAQNCYLGYTSVANTLASAMGITEEYYVQLTKNMIDMFKERKTWHKVAYWYGRKSLNV